MGTQVRENHFDAIISTMEKGNVGTFAFEDERDEADNVVGVLGRRKVFVKGT